MEKEQDNIERETEIDCPILFQMANKPCTETCMCWGWEFGKGFEYPVSEACRELEVLNQIFYPKYRVRIQADQIKSKYGELRFYYSIVRDPNCLITWIANKVYSIYYKFSDWDKYDYKMKKIVDVEPFDYDDIEEISEEEYKNNIDKKYKPSNVEWKKDEKTGKFIEVCHLRNYGKSHMVPTRLKTLWYFKQLCYRIYCRLMSYPKKENRHIRNITSYLETRANEIIKKAEKKCSETCEYCGNQIGTTWSPKCSLTGWITYVCNKCAEKSNKEYYKNSELWIGNKKIESEKELSSEIMGK